MVHTGWLWGNRMTLRGRTRRIKEYNIEMGFGDIGWEILK
jgi:hypothetical protein